jgi:hypothetical protein
MLRIKGTLQFFTKRPLVSSVRARIFIEDLASCSTHQNIIYCSKCLNTDQRNPINCIAAATADVISTNRGQPSVEIC